MHMCLRAEKVQTDLQLCELNKQLSLAMIFSNIK
jgi:hypothetical protein